MQAVAYSTFRANMKSYMRKMRDEADAILIVNKAEDENMVAMNARDYDSLMETIRIYENPKLHDKILRGMSQVEHGEGRVQELIDA